MGNKGNNPGRLDSILSNSRRKCWKTEISVFLNFMCDYLSKYCSHKKNHSNYFIDNFAFSKKIQKYLSSSLIIKRVIWKKIDFIDTKRNLAGGIRYPISGEFWFVFKHPSPLRVCFSFPAFFPAI